MLRRVARVSHRALFVLGVAILALYPLTWCRAMLLSAPLGRAAGFEAIVADGTLSLTLADDRGIRFRFTTADWLLGAYSSPLWPGYEQTRFPDSTYHTFNLPLWLIVAICLAWPVTSFIIARRKHKRGFPVEPKAPESVQVR